MKSSNNSKLNAPKFHWNKRFKIISETISKLTCDKIQTYKLGIGDFGCEYTQK